MGEFLWPRLYNLYCSPPLCRSLVTSIFREDYDWKDVRTNVLTMDFLMTKWHDGHYYCLICPSCDITFITIKILNLEKVESTKKAYVYYT